MPGDAAALLRSRSAFAAESTFAISTHVRSAFLTLALLGLVYGNYIVFHQYISAMASGLFFSIAVHPLRDGFLRLWRFTLALCKEGLLRATTSNKNLLTTGAVVLVFAMLPALLQLLRDQDSDSTALRIVVAVGSGLLITVVVSTVVVGSLLALSFVIPNELSFATVVLMFLSTVVLIGAVLFSVTMGVYEIIECASSMQDRLLLVSERPEVDTMIKENTQLVMQKALEAPAQLQTLIDANFGNDTIGTALRKTVSDFKAVIEKTAQSKEKLDIAKLASIMQTFSMNHSVSDLGGKMLNAVQSSAQMQEHALIVVLYAGQSVSWCLAVISTAVDKCLQTLIFVTVTGSLLTVNEAPHENIIRGMCLSETATAKLTERFQKVVERAIHMPFMCAAYMTLGTLVSFHVFQWVSGFLMMPFIAAMLTFLLSMVPIVPPYLVALPWCLGIWILFESSYSWLWALALGFIQYSVYTQITNEVYDDAASGAYFTALAIAMGFQTMGPLGIFYGPLLLSSFVVIMMYAVESNAPAAGSEEDVDDEAKSVERQEQMCAYVRSLWLFRRSGSVSLQAAPHGDFVEQYWRKPSKEKTPKPKGKGKGATSKR